MRYSDWDQRQLDIASGEEFDRAERRHKARQQAAETERLFEQLRSLTSRWNDHEDIPLSQQHECRQIGVKLHVLGGEQLMREAYYDAKGHNRAVVVIQAYWDGIGEWRW